MKKHLKLQIFQQLCSMERVYLGKMYVLFLELPFFKYTENAVFLFKNPRYKEKGPFLFENVYFCYVWWLSLFPK